MKALTQIRTTLIILLLTSPFLGMMVMHGVARSLEYVPVDPVAACYNTHFAALESVQNSIHTVRAEVFGDDAEIAILRLINESQEIERKLAECAEILP